MMNNVLVFDGFLPPKVQQRGASLEFCPWCAAKGLTFHVCSYRLNYHESIHLCTNPQCLFPLVSRPLEDVLAGLVRPEPPTGIKRGSTSSELLEEEEEEASSLVPSPKRLRLNQSHGPLLQNGADTHETDLADEAIDGGDDPAAGMVRKVKGHCRRASDWSGSEAADQEALQEKTTEAVAAMEKVLQTSGSTDPLEHGGSTDALEHSGSTDTLEYCSSTDALEYCSSTEALERAGSTEALEYCSSTEALEHGASTEALEHGSSTETLEHGGSTDTLKHSASTVALEHGASTEALEHGGSTEALEHGGPTDQCTSSTDPARTDDCSDRRPEAERKGGSAEERRGAAAAARRREAPVSVPRRLFWKNENSLCWLDALLVALVNCRTLRRRKPKSRPRPSSAVWQLLTAYDRACDALQAQQQTRDGVVTVPHQALQKANSDLQRSRTSIFKLLQPRLQCELGQRETPVFAIPLLLNTNAWVEPLFQLTFHWEFTCTDCKSTTNLQVTKPLPTFTNIVPDWHPLHASHLTSCNECCQKNQRRTMVLESVPPVFSLHFVEGLPDNDVSAYSFSFQESRYSVTTVLQYDPHLQHFVTWTRQSDGSWLEFDDLKHPDCVPHPTLPVPAQEIHIVFWEREEAGEEPGHGPAAGEPAVRSPDRSLFIPHDDSDLVGALTACDAADDEGDSCIGSTTLLDTFEGLTHDDIVTLTLVEVKADAGADAAVPSDADNQTPNDDGMEVATSSPAPEAPGSLLEPNASPRDSPSEGNDSSPEVPDTQDDLSSDPTFEPGSKRRRVRSKARVPSRPKEKKKAEPAIKAPRGKTTRKVPAGSAPSAPSRHPETPAPSPAAPGASPASSVKTPPPPDVVKRTTEPPPSADQNARWSHLLSMHPHSQRQNPTPTPTPVAQRTPSLPNHPTPTPIAQRTPSLPNHPTPTPIAQRTPSLPNHPTPTPIAQRTPSLPNHPTPNPVAQRTPSLSNHSTPDPTRRRQTPVGLYPRPQLRKEDASLPLNAAEVYGAFCAKAPVPPRTPVAPVIQTKVASRVSFPPPGVTELAKISKKSGGHSPKVPCSPGDTDALRYKLLKKLKAKKKKLLKLNQLLGAGGEVTPTPDSTDRGSPYSVSSSTYDSNTYDQFFAELLSPATATSSLSPDSTGFLEMLNNGPEGGRGTVGGASRPNAVTPDLDSRLTPLPAVDGPMTSSNDDFLDELISETAVQQQTEMEVDALSALDLFF